MQAPIYRVESRLQSWLVGLPVGAERPAPPVRTPYWAQHVEKVPWRVVPGIY